MKKFSADRKEPEWLLRRRLEAFDQFKELPDPSFRYGLHIMLRPELNLDNLEIDNENVKNATQIWGFGDKLGKLIKQDKFSTLNFAFANIHLIEAKENEQLNIEIADKNQFSHTVILAKPNSHVNIFESVNESGNYKSNFIEIYAEEGSTVNFASLQNLGKNVNYISGKYASISEGAKVNWFDISLGAKFAKSDVVSFLRGKNAATNNYGLFLGNQDQQFDLYSAAIHEAEDTKSDILMKGILKDKAKSLYRGLVKINEKAANSDGYQKEEVLLLSEEAEADVIPNLEIDNGNVRCSHGASIGNIDKEKLFYLMSRGLDKEAAVKLIVEGFFDSLLAKADVRNVKDIIMEKLK